MWVLQLYVNLCHFLQSPNTHAGERAHHRCTCAHLRCGFLLVAPCIVCPLSECRLLTASNGNDWILSDLHGECNAGVMTSDTKPSFAYCFVHVSLHTVTNIHASFVTVYTHTLTLPAIVVQAMLLRILREGCIDSPTTCFGICGRDQICWQL